MNWCGTICLVSVFLYVSYVTSRSTIKVIGPLDFRHNPFHMKMYPENLEECEDECLLGCTGRYFKQNQSNILRYVTGECHAGFTLAEYNDNCTYYTCFCIGCLGYLNDTQAAHP